MARKITEAYSQSRARRRQIVIAREGVNRRRNDESRRQKPTIKHSPFFRLSIILVNVNHDVRYELIIYWSEQDQAFIAEVPELPGCAADGATYQECVAAVEIVIREWLETAQELGRPIPKPRGRLLYA